MPPNQLPEQSDRLGAGIDFADPRSPLARYYARTSQVVFTAALAAVFLLVNYAALWHTDIWGHLKFGEWLLTHGRLSSEPFTPFGDRSTNLAGYCWLGQAWFALTYRLGAELAGGDAVNRLAGGVDALRFLHAVLVTGRIALLAWAVYRASRSWPLTAAAAVILPVLFLGNLGVARPQVVAELLFAALVCVAAAPAWHRSYWWAVPILIWTWANTHGSYPIGLTFITIVTIGRYADRLQIDGMNFSSALFDKDGRNWLIVTIVSFVAVVVGTPAGPGIVWNTWQMANHPNIRFMDEWQPLSFSLNAGGHWVYLLTIVAATAAYLLSPTPIPWSQLLLIFAFGILPLRHQRAFVWWLALVPMLCLPHLPAIAGRFGWPAGRPSAPCFRKTLAAAAFVVLAVLWSIPGQWLLDGRPRPLSVTLSAGTPRQLVDAITGKSDALPKWAGAMREYPEGRFRGRIFPSETLGDYFIWHLAPDVEVYIYSHVHLFPADHWRRVQTVRAAGKGWAGILDEAQVNLIVVEAEQNARLCDKLRADREWVVVLDEAGSREKLDKKCRLFAAVRKRPL